MRTKVQRWGNSLAVRIPGAMARQLGLAHDSQVDLDMRQQKLVLTPVRKPKPSLSRLLAAVTPSNVHGDVDTGAPAGRETW